jgi:hypothetical protein
MTDPASRQIRVSASADDGQATVGLDTGAGVRLGSVDPVTHDFDPQSATIAPQLIAGRMAGREPTKITSGEWAPDGRLVAGDVAEFVRVVRRMDASSQGTVTPEQAAALRGNGPTGVATIRGRALLNTEMGLGYVEGFLVAGGYQRTELDPEGQHGKIPAAADAWRGRFSTFPGEGYKAGLSMPVRFDYPTALQDRTRNFFQYFSDDGSGDGPGVVREFDRATNAVVGETRVSRRPAEAGGTFESPKATDVTARPDAKDAVEVWGILAPYDETTRTHLDRTFRDKDPEGYQGFARHAPYFQIDVDKMLGKPPPDPPPPEDGDPKPPEPQPPPGGGGGGEPPKPPEVNPQEQRNRNSFALPGADPTENLIAQPETEQPTTEAIDDGAGNDVSPIKDGIDRTDGGEEDEEDAGGAGSGQEQDQGGGENDGGGPQINDPQEPTECPIGGRKPVVTVREVTIGGHVFIETRVDGKVVSLVRKEGGILTPTDADANSTPPPPPGGSGEVSSGGKTYTFEGGRITGVRQDSGGILTPQPGTTNTGPTPPPGGNGLVTHGGRTYVYEGGKVTRVSQNGGGGVIGAPSL